MQPTGLTNLLIRASSIIKLALPVEIGCYGHTGGSEGTAPSEMKAYLNRDDLDFGTASELPPQQKWELQENLRGEIEYPTK